MTDHIVECSSVVRALNGRVILDGLCLSVSSGERFAILGTSGSGKSTLLRLLAGLDPPTAGAVLLNGVPPSSVLPGSRRVGMVFQRTAVYAHLTVCENLAFPLEMRRVPRTEIARRVGELAEILGLAPVLSQRAGTLSGGEAQRVAIGRAIAVPPQLLLLDEPLSNLHQSLRWKLLDDLRELHSFAKLTTILVTHDPGEAAYFADRIAVLSGGRIVQVGTPDELLISPRHLDTAKLCYDPAANIIDGKFREREPGVGSFEANSGDFALSISVDAHPRPSAVCLVFRAQDAEVHCPADSEPGQTIVIPALLAGFSRFHESSLATVRVGENRLRALADTLAPSTEPGSPVAVHIQAARVSLFDPISGQRISAQTSDTPGVENARTA